MENQAPSEMTDEVASEMFYQLNPDAVQQDMLPETMTDDQAAAIYTKEKSRQPLDFSSIPAEFDDASASQLYQQAKQYGDNFTQSNPSQSVLGASSGSYSGNVGSARRPQRLPIQGRISQEYGASVNYEPSGRHGGTDIAVPTGTPIPEAVGGTVLSAGINGGYGQSVLVKGSDGVTRRYSHLSQLSVKQGDTINPGQLVGLSGNSGRSTGPHLDYREYVNQ